MEEFGTQTIHFAEAGTADYDDVVDIVGLDDEEEEYGGGEASASPVSPRPSGGRAEGGT